VKQHTSRTHTQHTNQRARE